MSLLIRKTSWTLSSTLQKANRPPFCRTRPIQAQEPPEGGRAREHHPIQVDHQVGLAPGPDVGFVMLAEVANRVRVQPQAVPEFGHEDAALALDLDHGLEHGGPV